VTPRGPQPAAKLSLSASLAEGQELQGCGEAPAKQRWWGGGLWGHPILALHTAARWDGDGATTPGAARALPWPGGEGASHSSGGLWELCGGFAGFYGLGTTAVGSQEAASVTRCRVPPLLGAGGL